MDNFSLALSYSGMSIVMVFGVLVLLMLAMQLSASFFSRAEQKAAQQEATRATLPQSTQPAVHTSDETDEERLSVILAALQAAQIDVPAGGRVRIEKVSRGS